jgi:thiol:disulfide interchange protein DsbD
MRAALLLAFLTCAAPAAVSAAADDPRPAAWTATAFEDGNARLEGRLLLHPERSDDGRLRAGVLLTLDPGWHVTWQNAGDGGLATRLRFRGAEAGPVQWPAPSGFRDGRAGLTRYGYAGDVLVTSELRPTGASGRIEVEVETLVCRTACIPARLSLTRSISRVEPPETAAAIRRLFARQAETLPKPPRSLGFEPTLRELSGDRLALVLSRCEGSSSCRSLAAPRFAPVSDAFRVLDASDAEGEIVILLEREPHAPERLAGVLSLVAGDGRSHHLAIDLAPRQRVAASDGAAFAAVLALAFALGLLMNGMPSCVARLQAALDGPGAGASGTFRTVAWAVGVVTGLLAATSLVLGARSLVGPDSTGLAVGVALLCTVSASNLFDVFAVPGSAPPERARDAGFTGGLLVFWRGWPCSLPLLAPAIGLAFFVAPRLAVAAAVALGLGHVAPRALLRGRPGWAEWLPQPGPWSSELRRALGFLPLGAAAWLVARVARGAGAEAAGWTLGLLFGVALVLWVSARLPALRLRAAALACGLALVALVMPRVLAPPEASFAAESAVWGPDTLDRLRAMHRPVLVVFTADWCAPCRWNEQAVVASALVRAALARGGYTVLRADWTDRGEGIQRELARFGRAGVPLTLVYRADAARPERLPDVLTVDAVLAALGAGSGPASVESPVGAEAPSDAE